MKLLHTCLVALVLAFVSVLLGGSLESTISDYPNEAYFRTHSRQQSWNRINQVYQEAQDEFDAEQKRLEKERSERLARARGDEEQKAVHRWYDTMYADLAERRRLEYQAKEVVQKLMIAYYDSAERRTDPLGRPELRDAPVW